MATATTQVKILVPGHQSMVTLLGQRDAFLKQIEVAFPADVLVRGNEITITGTPEATEQVGRVFEELLELLEQGYELTEDTVRQTISMVTGASVGDIGDDEERPRPSDVLGDNLLSARGKKIAPKTFGQKRYVDAIRRSTVTFAIGPAGTGKTYLAVAVAVRALQERQISRIILTRPAVEAGERLGFLPGTLYEKIDPYMRPLYDALYEMTGPDTLPRLMERGIVEVAPLAFMRGRTLNDAFIILDEAQNTTPEQMKMFLTRLGFGSKAVVNGDATQVDLQGGPSGLSVVEEILTDIEGISFVHLGRQGRRAPPDRAGDRRGLRPLRAAAARGRRLTAMRDDDQPPPERPTVLLSNRQPTPVDEAGLLELARTTLRGEGLVDVELSVSFVDEAEIEDLHVRYMDEPGPTDVLSFALGEVDEDGVRLLGDVVIAPAVAARNNPGGSARGAPAPARPRDLAPARLRPRARHREGRRCGRGRNATAGCARRDLDRLDLAAGGVLLDRVHRVPRRIRGRDHADEQGARGPPRRGASARRGAAVPDRR